MGSREKYKVVNPYAVCHIMKKQYGWTSHKKWQCSTEDNRQL
jgi:hypothetical protein